jgi:hypothetical protein
MRAADLRQLAPLFDRITELQRFMIAAAATRSNGASCGCSPVAGRHELAGQCKPAPPAHCRSVVHVAARASLHQLHIPVEHLTDEELEAAIAGLARLVDRAPQVTQEEFVIRMQHLLRAVPEQPVSEETPAQ